MEELGTPARLTDERMGHEGGSVQARYRHITPVMRQRLLAGLTELWEGALDARLQLAERSAVAAPDRLLVERREEVGR